MSAPDTIGSVCIKNELKGTDKFCACKKCSKEESFTRGMTTNLPMWDEYSLERLNTEGIENG